jgi:hypothetical protein
MGYVGMVQTPSGLTGELLHAGHHVIYNRDRLYLIELSEALETEKLKILCADDLNFSFDLKVRARLKVRDAKGITAVLTRLGAKMKETDSMHRVLSFKLLYNTFVKPQARSLARSIVSNYSTTQIRANRMKIQKVIYQRLLTALKGTPMELMMVATSNFDYPKVVTIAMEKKREREIAIGQEKAKQAMALLRANNRLRIAQRMMQVRATEAKAEAIYYRIIGKALTPQYLKMRNLKNQMTLFQRVSPGDKVIFSSGGNQRFVPMLNVTPKSKVLSRR